MLPEENDPGVKQIIAMLEAVIAKSPAILSIDWIVKLSRGVSDISFSDSSGHRRPVYRLLAIYSWAIHFPSSATNQQRFNLKAWCELLEDKAETDLAITAWAALTLAVAGRAIGDNRYEKSAAETFHSICRCQQANGSFLSLAAHESAETFWFDELVLLHAVVSYAMIFADNLVLKSAVRNAEYHMNETQPDHATCQPWAVAAFAIDPGTRIVADQLIHTAAVASPSGITDVPLLLLADALYCLKL